MTKERLNRAGWLSITSAIFAIQYIVMSMYLDTIEGTGAKLSQAILTIVSLGLFIYIVSSLKKLINSRFQFHDVDIYISLLIWGNVILCILSILSLESIRLEFVFRYLSMIALIIFGILSIMFATRLLRLSGNLYGLLKTFCYTQIVCGICFITVFLLPAGIIVGAVSDVILGVIFFRAAEQPPSTIEILSTPIE